MNLQELNTLFSIPDCLVFGQADGLLYARVTTRSCTAEFYLQGAHLTKWQPAGHNDVLFLSSKSLFQPGKAIRGGVPIIFPWFGARSKNDFCDRTDGPSHGFARTTNWQMISANLKDDDLEIVLKLKPTANSRELGFDHFTVLYKMTLGKQLHLSLRVINNSLKTMQFEEALHTYLAVSDISTVGISGLKDAEYFDKTDNFNKKIETAPQVIKGETDRLYINTKSTVTVQDPTGARQISVSKMDSDSTVVWNPWSEVTAKLADMEPDGWRSMVCVETANAGPNAIVLAPGQGHTMQTTISVN